jgi:hypothetical protein
MNTPVEGFWHVRSYATGLPEGYYGHRWDYDHLNNGQWVAQMYSPTGGDAGLWFRQRRNYDWQTWRKFLDSSNYSSYALPLSGGTLSGTLRFGDSTNGIYLSGGRLNIRSESTDNVAEYASYGLYLPKTGQTAGLYVESPIEARGGLRIGGGAGNGTITVGADTSATPNRLVQRDASGHITGNYILGSYFNASAGNSENPTIGQVWTQSTGDNYLRKSTPAHFISQLGLITTSNYSSYALPLSGGTLTGNLTMSGPGTSNSIIFGDNSKRINVEGYWMMFKGHENEGFRWQTAGQDAVTYTTRMQLTSSALTMNGNTVVHAGNVSSYALPIGGGTLTDATKIKAGHGNTRFQLHYNHDNADSTSGYAGYLTLWASEPGMSYAYTGIGGNINIGGNYYGRQTSGQSYGLYLRFETASGFSEFWATTGAVGAAGGQGIRVAYIDANGSGVFSGNVTAYSDERLKKDWAAIPSGFVERLAQIKSGTYTRIDSNERQAGSSAQDWQALLPEVVNASNDEAQTLSLAYGNAALVSAIELAKEVVDLKSKLNQQQSELDELKSLVQSLLANR